MEHTAGLKAASGGNRATGRAHRYLASLLARRRQLTAVAMTVAVALGGCEPKSAAPTTSSVAPATPVAAYQPAPQPGAQVAQPVYPNQAAPAPYPQQPVQPTLYPPQPVQPAPYPPQYAVPPAANTTYPSPYGTAVAAAQPAAPAPVYNDNGPPPQVQPQPQPRAQAQAPRAAPRSTHTARAAAPVPSGRLGRVTRIEPIEERPSGTGVGGVAGAAIGGLVGNHFGGGLGRTALTVLGVAGGAVAGNNVERNVRERTVGYKVEIELDNGESRLIQETSVGDLKVGDRVRVTGNGFRRV